MSWENWIKSNSDEKFKFFKKDEYKRIYELFCFDNSRNAEAVIRRQLFCYEMRKKGKFKYEDIAEIVKRDHATVIYSVKKVEDYISISDPQIRNAEIEFNRIKKNLS